MREIKFRGKSKELGCEGQWVTGYFFKDKKDGYMILGDEPQYGWFNHRIEEETLGQYTGLKDKNNKEIWEGDILKWNWVGETIKPVIFKDGNFHPEGYQYSLFQKYEIIGNIHDNPELLKQREG